MADSQPRSHSANPSADPAQQTGISATVSQAQMSIETSQSGSGSSPSGRQVSTTSDLPLPDSFGRYKIEKELGKGAMGIVYLAEDTQLGRKVALKIPNRTALETPESIERFYREARTTATLRHNNICQVYDVGEMEGAPYLAMEFIPGKALKSYVNKAKLPSARQVALLIRKIALALDEAHSKGVIHRDLKPANVMLDDRGEPKVMDFGLARNLNTAENARLTQSNAILGTPAYMAPEQVRSELDQIGPRTDIYALGVILYQFLSGELPFDGPIMMVFAQILTEQPKRPSEVRSGVDPSLEAICLKMMAKNMGERYASMKEVAAALMEYLKTGTASAVDTSSTGTSHSTIAAQAATFPEFDFTSLGEVSSTSSLLKTKVVKKPADVERSPSRWKITGAIGGVTVVVVLITAIGKLGSKSESNLLPPPDEIARVAAAAKTEIKVPIPEQADASREEDSREANANKLTELACWIKKMGGTVTTGERPYDWIDPVTIDPWPEGLEIRKIYLKDPAVTDKELLRLSAVKNLTELILEGTSAKCEGLRQPALRSLRELSLRNSSFVDDDSLKAVRALQSLQTLTLNRTGVTDKGLVHLSSHLGLTSIVLENNAGLSGEGLRYLVSVKNLNNLTLRETGISDEGLSGLKAHPALRWLRLEKISKLAPQGLEHLGGMQKLEFLEIDSELMTESGIAGLSSMRSLPTITLLLATDEVLGRMSRMEKLSALTLEYRSKITAAGVAALAGCSGLKRLTIYSPVKDDMLDGLLQLKQLDYLYLSRCQTSKEGRLQLRRFLPTREIHLRNDGTDFVQLDGPVDKADPGDRSQDRAAEPPSLKAEQNSRMEKEKSEGQNAERTVITQIGPTSDPVACLAISPDQQYLLVGESNGRLTLHNVANGKSLKTFASRAWQVSSLAFNADGTALAAVAGRPENGPADEKVDYGVQHWAIPSGKLLAWYPQSDAVNAIAIAPSGVLAAAVGRDRRVHLLDLRARQELRQLTGSSYNLDAVTFIPGSDQLVCGAERNLEIWNWKSGHSTATHGYSSGKFGAERIKSISSSADGHFLLAGTDTGRVWCKPLATANSNESWSFEAHDGTVTSVSFTASGKHFLTAGWDGAVHLWNFAPRPTKVATFSEHNGRVLCAAFSPDEKFIVSGGMDKTVRVWETPAEIISADLPKKPGKSKKSRFK